VRELRQNLADWLDRAEHGEEILITERGRPKARLTAATSAFDTLVAQGRITPAHGRPRPLPDPIEMDGPIMPFLEWARGGPWPGAEREQDDGAPVSPPT